MCGRSSRCPTANVSTRFSARSSTPARCSAGSAHPGSSSRPPLCCARTPSRATRRSARRSQGTSAAARGTERSSRPCTAWRAADTADDRHQHRKRTREVRRGSVLSRAAWPRCPARGRPRGRPRSRRRCHRGSPASLPGSRDASASNRRCRKRPSGSGHRPLAPRRSIEGHRRSRVLVLPVVVSRALLRRDRARSGGGRARPGCLAASDDDGGHRDVPGGDAMTIVAKPRIRGGVGESVARTDAPPKVKGEFAYASDLAREGMLYGATLRSPHAHARILRIDTAAARKMPGVQAVLTADDLPTREKFGLMKLDQPVLATGVVRYVGEPVAIVAAEDAEQARLAVRAIKVEYEPLAAITDPIAALQPGAAKLHDDGNVIEDVRVVHGDPNATADVVVEGEYEVAMQDQARSVPRPASRSPIATAA